MAKRAGLYPLFFLSGATALVYELVWQRLLNLVFGVSTLSVSATLAAFMGGLALGGLLFGRRADRAARPLGLYAALEAGIGLTSLLVPPGFAALAAVYPALHARVGFGAWGGACLRFGMAMVVLAVPATLIGGTVPVMARLCRRPGRTLPASFGLLYAVNTLGAVAGAGLTGFVLLRWMGMRDTLWLAAALNLFVAALAAVGSRSACEIPESEAEPHAKPRGFAPVLTLACAAVTGAAGTGLEVVWMRILGILTSNSAHGFALMLSVLLLGLALGSFLQAWAAPRPGDGWRRLALCQWLLAGFVLATLPYFTHSPDWLARCSASGTVSGLFLGELALTVALLFVPSVCMGMTLPLLVCAAFGGRHFGRRVGRLYAVNAFAGVVGPFAAGFVLVPAFGIKAALGVGAALAVAVGVAAWNRAPVRRPLARWLVPPGVVAAAACGWLALPPAAYQKSLVTEPRLLLAYAEGDNATVTVVEEADGTRNVLVDSQPVAGTGGTSVVDQKMLAHLPLLLHPDPRRALTVGFGSGGTSHSMTLHGIDVDCVEIEARVPDMAGHFASENAGVLEHPHFRLVLDDARSHLRVTPTRYDVIVTDCTNIQYRSNGDLYTADYFRLMKGRLTAGGLAAAWVPANGIRPDDLKTLLRSFRAAFPHTSVWFMNSLPTDFLIVVGSPDALRVDLDAWRVRMRRPGVAEDLESVGLADPCRLLATLLACDDGLRDYLGDGPVNTDDRPVLSYSTYGSNYRATIAENLLGLMAHRADAARVVRSGDAASLLRTQVASTETNLGQIAMALGRGEEALTHYVAAAKLLPDDHNQHGLVLATYARLRGGK